MVFAAKHSGLGLALAGWAAFAAGPLLAQSTPSAAARHAVTIADILALRSLSELDCAPDGRQAVYVVGEADVKADKRRSALWLADMAGDAPLQLTSGEDSASAPAFSPDGRTIAFLSKRGKDKLAQIWLLDRRGGEASKLTDVKGSIDGFRWSPDSKTLLLTISDPATEPPKDDPERPLPVVVDDVKFKQDGTGFITAESHTHLALFDVAARTETRLMATDAFDAGAAEWSPDGKYVVYMTDHTADPADLGGQWLTVVEARAGAAPKLVAKLRGASGQTLLWSADGTTITHLVGPGGKADQYGQPHLAQTVLATGQTRVLPATAGVYVSAPVSLGAGRIGVVLAEDRREVPAVVDPLAGTSSAGLRRLGDRRLAILEQCGSADPKAARAVVASGDGQPAEIYALDAKGALKPLTSHNKVLAESVLWAKVEDYAATAKDGNEVHGLLMRPSGMAAGGKVPTLLWIHGGPNAQDIHAVDGYSMIAELLAAQGYAVLMPNYRGSSGRGDAYAAALAADWGNKDVADLHATLDWAVAQGFADPARLGAGGWSYGGILTDFLIVRDNRLKAAFSGAGEGNIFALFGVDQYIQQYTQELGPPWQDPALWMRLSEPLMHADRIRTPTLFMGGIADDNVPLVGGQQLYQALKLTGVPTRLVGYPDENHGITRPSFQRDRLERIVDWFARYLK
ncbi:MAG: peptidase S9 family protein [Novosphingobium sp. PASSN1]|nr:MAG: peptidase S9 family protein [Novosphingobium sp. PASSN1]